MVLILDHLLHCGYLDAVEALQRESGVNMRNFEVADNVDLMTVVSVRLASSSGVLGIARSLTCVVSACVWVWRYREGEWPVGL